MQAEQQLVETAPGARAGTARGLRWLAAVGVGVAAAIPVGVLLSYLGLLVMYLGLFFYLLLGLMLGAAMFRVGRHRRPVPRAALIAGAAAVALVAFCVSLVLESRRLGSHVASKAEYPPSARRVTPQNVEDARAELETQQQQVRDIAERMLAERYPPGGVLGYLRWAAADGRLEFEVPFEGPPVKYKLSQSPLGFKLRVVLCLFLLTGGVVTQVWPLRRGVGQRADAGTPGEPATMPPARPPT